SPASPARQLPEHIEPCSAFSQDNVQQAIVYFCFRCEHHPASSKLSVCDNYEVALNRHLTVLVQKHTQLHVAIAVERDSRCCEVPHSSTNPAGPCVSPGVHLMHSFAAKADGGG